MPDSDWTSPDTFYLRVALQRAERLARDTKAAQTICATVHNHRLGYRVFGSETFDLMRSRGTARQFAPVASVLPSGGVQWYDETFNFNAETTHV